jgi:hypothetical protein
VHFSPGLPIAAVALLAAAAQIAVGVQSGAIGSPAPGVLQADGSVNATAYRQMAKSLASPTGITYRFGDAADGAQTDSTVYAPPSKKFDGYGHSTNRSYQVAGPENAAINDFSSNQGQVGYVASGTSPKIGVDHLETLGMSNNTFSEKPQLAWPYYGGGHPEPDLLAAGGSGACLKRLGVQPGRFVAQARAYAHGEATANSIIAFDNGVIAAAGTNTATAGMCTKLPAHLHPSAISVTDGNEFALVTAWNTRTLRSELVVIALGGARAGSDFWKFDWQKLYPGLRNYGRPTFAKVLGSIELPIVAPTSLSAVSNNSQVKPLSMPKGGNATLGDLTLSNEANRKSFISGVNKGTVSNSGYAVIGSREEKKVVFVDLQPLFQQVTQQYFTSRSTFDRITSNVGLGATQWPYDFTTAPKEQPVVTKTVQLTEAPSAVAAMLSGARSPRAYVATTDGKLHVFATRGLASSKSASAEAIKEVGTISVGLNPTNITYVKDRATGDTLKQTLNNTLIITARGSRAVQWVHLKGDKGSVARTLRDSRLTDPIAAEDNNTHGTESYVVSVADYSGRQLANYRYGPIIFHTNGGARYGMGANGKAAFEFGGAYKPGGRPFSISITNVT